jgi:hypothetical protein
MLYFRSQSGREDRNQAQVFGGGDHEPGHGEPRDPAAHREHCDAIAETVEQFHQDKSGQEDNTINEDAPDGHVFVKRHSSRKIEDIIF